MGVLDKFLDIMKLSDDDDYDDDEDVGQRLDGHAEGAAELFVPAERNYVEKLRPAGVGVVRGVNLFPREEGEQPAVHGA